LVPVTVIAVLVALALALIIVGAAASNGDEVRISPSRGSKSFASGFIRIKVFADLLFPEVEDRKVGRIPQKFLAARLRPFHGFGVCDE